MLRIFHSDFITLRLPYSIHPPLRYHPSSPVKTPIESCSLTVNQSQAFLLSISQLLPSGENGEWTCNAASTTSTSTVPGSTSWICILGCAPGWRVVGDGVVGADSGDGVIFCNDGQWSRDDFYCSQSL